MPSFAAAPPASPHIRRQPLMQKPLRRYSCTFSASAKGTRLMRRMCSSATARYVANPMAMTSAIAVMGT